MTAINRACGYGAGDAALATVSRALAHALRAGERAAWWSGDQWIVVFSYTGRGRALRCTRRILSLIAADAATVSLSAGVAASPVDATTNSTLVAAAAVALQRAKREGRGGARLPTRRFSRPTRLA